jgi:hypothetical protein
MKLFFAAFCIATAIAGPAGAQTRCDGVRLAGVVIDSTAAIVPGAQITLDGSAATESTSRGSFEFPCVAAGKHHLRISAKTFATSDLDVTLPLSQIPLTVTLQPATVQTTVQVGAAASPMAAGGGHTISGNQLAALADDPDDLLLQLQQFAAASGGNPANTTISVDGFQDSSKLPPKSAIAYINVNPDLFSAEYREPPIGEGGRVEVYTKPGQDIYHGSLFMTNGSPWMNARDPFSTSRAPLGKQTYGFDLSGPVRKKSSDFTMALEHRSIDNFAVVNAITLDSAGNVTPTVSNVATPQRLWVGTARVGRQVGAKNTLTASYSANVNSLKNVGVGGTSLAETGYGSQQYEHVLRLTNVTTASAKLMHEARLSLKWDGENDDPLSTAPQVQVAGAFTGGGSTLGAQRLHEFAIEADEDVVLSTSKHLLKFGVQTVIDNEHQNLTTNFNGTYTFGGGPAPVLDANGNPIAGETEIITGLEQYRRAQLGLAGGSATAFSNVAGSPQVDFTQVTAALFAQDDWKLRPNLHLVMGLRYAVQSDPETFNGITPRAGLSWSPGEKSTWELHAHAGLFVSDYNTSDVAEIRRMDGVARVTSTVYNPVYGNPLGDGTPIRSLRTVSPHLTNANFSIENIGTTKALPGGWNLSADFFTARIWNYARSENINSPLNDSPTGPRPGPANLNILEVQNSGQGGANLELATLEQHTLKHLQLFLGAIRVNLFDDTDNNLFFTPQSSHSDAGEFARRDGQGLWHIFGNSTVKLPFKLELSGTLNAAGDSRYNITTGFDNNGDGDFNDRPQYASPGDPDAIATPFGQLVLSGGLGTLPRNKGAMPWTVYLNGNLQRSFSLTRDAKAAHPQTLAVNLRSANALNHLNVTQVGGVLGSPLFGVPYAADNGRRIECGLRYSF